MMHNLLCIQCQINAENVSVISVIFISTHDYEHENIIVFFVRHEIRTYRIYSATL